MRVGALIDGLSRCVGRGLAAVTSVVTQGTDTLANLCGDLETRVEVVWSGLHGMATLASGTRRNWPTVLGFLAGEDVVRPGGRRGMGALTHRAVDTRVGLPQGTTSAYFRTRAALLAGIVKRLADRDREDLRALGLDLDSGDAEDGGASKPADQAAQHAAVDAAVDAAFDAASAAAATAPPDESLLTSPPSPELLDAITEATAGFIDTSLASARNRTLARYHCRLESITSPDLRRLLAPHEDAAYRQTRDLLASLATPDVETPGHAPTSPQSTASSSTASSPARTRSSVLPHIAPC